MDALSSRRRVSGFSFGKMTSRSDNEIEEWDFDERDFLVENAYSMIEPRPKSAIISSLNRDQFLQKAKEKTALLKKKMREMPDTFVHLPTEVDLAVRPKIKVVQFALYNARTQDLEAQQQYDEFVEEPSCLQVSYNQIDPSVPSVRFVKPLQRESLKASEKAEEDELAELRRKAAEAIQKDLAEQMKLLNIQKVKSAVDMNRMSGRSQIKIERPDEKKEDQQKTASKQKAKSPKTKRKNTSVKAQLVEEVKVDLQSLQSGPSAITTKSAELPTRARQKELYSLIEENENDIKAEETQNGTEMASKNTESG